MKIESLLNRKNLSPEVKAIIREDLATISKLKLERDELKKQSGFFKEIFEKSPIGIEIYNEMGLLMNANQACLDIFGVSDICHIKGFNLLEDPNIPNSILTKLLNHESVRYESVFDFDKVHEYQLYKTNKSGKINLDVLITPLIRYKEKELTGYLVQIQDITERTLAIETLKLSEESTKQTYKILVETMDAGVLLQDVEGRITFINPNLLDLLGVRQEEILGKKWDDLIGIHIDFKEEELTKIDKHTELRLLGASSSYEIEIIKQNGQKIPVLINASPFLDDKGEFNGVLLVVTDITEQKKLQKLQERFVAITSHELRTPLTVIKGYIDFIQSHPQLPSIEINKIYWTLNRNVARLNRLIENVHDLSKITYKLFTITPEKLDLDKFVFNLQDQFILLYPDRTIIVNYYRDKSNPNVFIDRDRILQIFNNLVSNAIKNSPRRSVVEIDIRKDQNKLQISVQDSGSGITFLNFINLFHPFSVAKTPFSAKGTGLGLYIVKTIVVAHGGRIEVLTKDNFGSVFTVILPNVASSLD
ncbi:MAG: PAS domain-containing sensor histidine kinase [Candidatus Hodarchaeales archaeon]|jgi:PAS domain S-box-containing protein